MTSYGNPLTFHEPCVHFIYSNLYSYQRSWLVSHSFQSSIVQNPTSTIPSRGIEQ
jgi:hypothetical protein